LMKPRVMLLADFTALVGLIIAPGDLDPLLGSIAIIGISAGAGAAGVLNVKAAALLAFAILFYVVVYTVWLKRHTPQNIIIGAAR